MGKPARTMTAAVMILAMFAGAATIWAVAGAEGTAILQKSGVTGGLVVHVGCDDGGGVNEVTSTGTHATGNASEGGVHRSGRQRSQVAIVPEGSRVICHSLLRKEGLSRGCPLIYEDTDQPRIGLSERITTFVCTAAPTPSAAATVWVALLSRKWLQISSDTASMSAPVAPFQQITKT